METDSTSSNANSTAERDRARSAAWFISGDKLSPSPFARDLFQRYSRIPADNIAAHIIAVREKAWKVYPYPCIGSFRFLDFAIVESPIYETVLERLKNGAKYLDLGCCFAQDLRALVHAGVPSENLFGADLQSDFLELSYELFNDKDSLKSTFYNGDIFDLTSFQLATSGIPNPVPFQKLVGDVDILSARSFLHLFGQEQEFKAACQMVEIMKDKEGSIIMGRQVGSHEPGFHSISLGRREVFRHNPETWKGLWRRVGEATNTKWDVQAHLVDIGAEFRDSIQSAELADIKGRAWLEFVITKL
ncbi:hypothetical protein H072_7627 [Dactylellina haptotyla CBS 200.50]|uniref:Methyltransferase domain-containing protein n=1 Tax=Dactylellina haptotyla (strain CBS 200.50) TaxID=1284197 RepID=S8ABW4_DACHA|nr:hypothetical protein H072_7627 [Dactylellina haptotyla CBS 200.50]